MPAAEQIATVTVWPFRRRLRAYLELTKPRIATLILIISTISFFLADRSRVAWGQAALLFVVVALLAGGIFALNHFMERDQDGLMNRTGDRPLPSGKLAPRNAFIFGITLTVASLAISLVLLNVITACVALFTAVSYLLVYTPLKRHTAYHTALGALSGATPPLMGWAAARGSLDADAWILFGILFFWQFPHFLSIDMMYREDYERAGIRVLPVVDTTGHWVAFQIVSALVLLIVVSILPLLTGLAGRMYVAGASLLGLWFLVTGIEAVMRRTKMSAKYLLRASVFYLPLLFLLMIANP
jgi:protoheme IX farnesyltransferase